jgi:hypothetical protein
MSAERVLAVPMVFDHGHSARVHTDRRRCTIRLTDGRLMSADVWPHLDEPDWTTEHLGPATMGDTHTSASDELLAVVRDMARAD